ncbi:hypothetical protein SAMN05444004_112113 [Jannaschia faecimaris]|uniref:Uncharacterized protein n=1 Tax=Jannaschia faecimaris TaxID=1244108 RepID=A0A1H3SLF2_9RHOB|nr:hypothetical protein [Jannaschia faecimaris]SDZ38903.1 hypothetical protein SAMN05444004_112113 [Jannaschia faecimaris]
MTFTIKNIAATALIALGAAVPATADVAAGSAAAISHFNQSADSVNGTNVLKQDAGVSVSTRSGQNLEAYSIFNADADTQDGIRGLNGATLYSGTPSNGAAIFAAINAASAQDE